MNGEGAPPVLVTRPPDRAGATAARLRALGWRPILSPLLEIRHHHPGLPEDDIQALLITSRGAIEALSDHPAPPSRDIPVHAVGEATARAARDFGFADVTAGPGDADALADRMVGTLDPRAGRILHLAGAHTAGTPRDRLCAAGLACETRILYTAEAVSHLPDVARRLILSGVCAGVCLYSARTAMQFRACLAAEGLEFHLNALYALCISERTARPLAGLDLAGVGIAARPDEDALIEVLARHLPPGQQGQPQ